MVLDLVKVHGPCLQRMVDKMRSISSERMTAKERERMHPLRIENIGAYDI